MNPTTVFCPNLACPARGQGGQSHVRSHARKDQHGRARADVTHPGMFQGSAGPAASIHSFAGSRGAFPL